MKEIWRDVKGFEGVYQVSNYGKVMGYPRISKDNRYLPPRILKGSLYSNGYLVVKLRFDGLLKRVAIHRLVAETFIHNPNGLLIINHKDENKLNNRVDNLEWCTHQYNTTYGTSRERQRETFVKNNSRRVRQYSLDGVFIKEYRCVADASRETGALDSEICACCSDKQRALSANGFQWKYSDICSDENIPAYSIKPSPLIQSVSQYTTNGDFIKTYRSIQEAVDTTKTRRSSIYACCVGRYKTANGYIWRYNN